MAGIDDKIQSAKIATNDIGKKLSLLNHVIASTEGFIQINATHGVEITSAQKTTAMGDYAQCKKDFLDATTKLP